MGETDSTPPVSTRRTAYGVEGPSLLTHVEGPPLMAEASRAVGVGADEG